MKLRPLVCLGLVTLVTACDRKTAGPTAEEIAAEKRRDEQRISDERRIAELRDLEQRAADREAAERAAATQREKQAIANERESIERERRALEARQAQARADEEIRMRNGQREQDRAAQDAAAQAQQARAEQTVDFFYDALEAHGEWLEVEGYDYVWRPRVAARVGWRPYTDGRWVFSEYGWTWQSNEAFGWATYHYGRWMRVRRIGWVWVPGTEWAPAWVSWRRGGDYIGWAPLPPEVRSGRNLNAQVDIEFGIGPSLYIFVKAMDLGEANYVDRALEPERNVTLVNQTTNITNVTYKTVENHNTVYNAGPEINISNQQSTKPVPKVEVKRIAAAPGARTEQSGNVIKMVAPEMAPAKANKKPLNIAQRVNRGEVGRGDDMPVKKPAPAEVPPGKVLHPAEPPAGKPPGAPAPTTPVPTPGKTRPGKPLAPFNPTPAPAAAATTPVPPSAPATMATPVPQVPREKAEPGTTPPEGPDRRERKRLRVVGDEAQPPQPAGANPTPGVPERIERKRVRVLGDDDQGGTPPADDAERRRIRVIRRESGAPAEAPGGQPAPSRPSPGARPENLPSSGAPSEVPVPRKRVPVGGPGAAGAATPGPAR